MKELSIEEKAKRYDEAKLRMSAAYNSNRCTIGFMNEIFPELKESEDEKIRKKLISFVKNWDKCGIVSKYTSNANDIKQILAWLEKQGDYHKGFHDGYNFGVHEEKPLRWTKHDEFVRKEAISCLKHWKNLIPPEWNEDYKNILIWLENELDIHVGKQGEQKPADKVEPKDFNSIDPQFGKSIDKVEPKFHEGDWIACEELNTAKIISVNIDRYEVEFIDGNKGFPHIDYIDRNFHLWTIKDAKDGDVLACENGWTCIFNCLHDNLFDSHCFMDAEGWFCEDGAQAHTLDNRICGKIYPATKEQRDLLFQKMKEEGYEWDANKKELKKIEDEEYNGEDYGIDGLWHAQRILEKTLGEVDGYQTDDGILSHQCAISAVKKLYEQKPAWSEEDEVGLANAIWAIKQARTIAKDENDMGNLWYAERWLKSIKDRIQSKFELTRLDKNILEAAVAFVEQNNHFNCWRGVDKHTVLSALHSLRPQNRWKPSEEQMEALDNALSLAKNCGEEGAFDLRTLYEQLKKLKGE